MANYCCSFWICMWVIGPGGATIYPRKGGRVTMGAQSSFSFIWSCLPPDVSLSATCSDCLIYHWPQIWKCGSPLWGLVTLLRAQSGSIMGEALTQSWGGRRGGWVARKKISRGEEMFYCASFHFFMTAFFKEKIWNLSVWNNAEFLELQHFQSQAY